MSHPTGFAFQSTVSSQNYQVLCKAAPILFLTGGKCSEYYQSLPYWPIEGAEGKNIYVR